MERLQAEWQRKLLGVWREMLEDLRIPAFVMTLNNDEPPLANSALKALLPGKGGFTAEMEPAAPVYAPARTVSFIQNGRKTRELVFDVFLVPAFTETGHRTAIFGLKREQGGKPDALLAFARCLTRFYDTDFMHSAEDMLNALPAGAAIMDEQGAFIFVSRSPAVWNDTGTSKMQGLSVLDYSDGALSRELIDSLVRGEISSIEWSAGKDGGDTAFFAVYRHAPGLLALAAAFTKNDTARESVEEAKAQKKMLEDIVDRSGVVAFVVKPSRDWYFSYVSKNIERFGISMDSDTTTRLGEHIEDYARFKVKARAAISGCREFSDTFRLINDNGTAFKVTAAMRVVNTNDGVQIQGSLTDTSALEAIKQQTDDAASGIISRMLSFLDGQNENPPAVTDILSADFLQEHQNQFADVFMLPSQIFDYSGREITKSRGNCMECSVLCGVSSNRNCKLWNAALSKLKTQSAAEAVVSCADSTLTAAFFPIYIGKHLSAVWKIGAVILEPANLDDAGLSYSTHHEFPNCKPETFRLAVETLSIISRNISAFAASCIRLANDMSRNEKLRAETDETLGKIRRIGDCAELASNYDNIHMLMESVSRAFEFDRLYIYTARKLTHEYLGDGVRPAPVREISPERWSAVSEKKLSLDGAALKVTRQTQTVWRPVWHDGKLFAVTAADYCLEHREFSETELETLDLMFASIGRLLVLRGVQNAEKEALAKLEERLENVTVLDYNTNSVIISTDNVPEDIPFDALIDEDGRITPPVEWESGGKRRKAAAFYWYDGRLAVLVKTV